MKTVLADQTGCTSFFFNKFALRDPHENLPVLPGSLFTPPLEPEVLLL
jgi:hypothetical protein